MLPKTRKSKAVKKLSTNESKKASGHSSRVFAKDICIPMRYKVVYDKPGRLRLRFGKYAFTKEQGYGIAQLLQGVLGVKRVIVHTSNGGVLIDYGKYYKQVPDKVKEALYSLERNNLPTSSGSDEQRQAEADMNFVRALASKLGFWGLRRAFLPAPISAVWTVFRSLSFIGKGLSVLAKGKMQVEVLDATALAASILQRNFNSAGMIMLLLDISSLMEDYTHARSRIALEQSLAITCENVWLCLDGAESKDTTAGQSTAQSAQDNGVFANKNARQTTAEQTPAQSTYTEVKVPLSSICPGDKIRVRTGSMIPVDGTIIAGEAAINEASMTGESKLAIKSTGATVFAGTIAEDGNIVIEVSKTGAQTRIANIVKMVDESQEAKANVQAKAQRLADGIVPFSFLGFFGVLALTRNITKAVSVLMIDYSCAIKISTPVAVMRAMREGAAHDILVKGGRYLEVMSSADTIIFDKTGTLTAAKPEVERIISFSDMTEVEILRLAACLEEHFPHSKAHAVVQAAKARGINHTDELHANVEYIVAHGIVSQVGKSRVLLGSAHFVFDDEHANASCNAQEMIAELSPSASPIYLAVDGQLKGAICISDPLRAEVPKTLRALKKAGFKNIVMLTGDEENAACAIAKEAGISKYKSQVLPQDKAAIVEEYKNAGHTVVMVGDGINDSPALACADASVAMVDASDIAREVADITLLHSSLDQLLILRELSEKLMKRISKNYRFIVGFNTALLVGGVAGFMQPTTGALLHNLSTMGVTASNMRLLLPKNAGHAAKSDSDDDAAEL